MTRRPMDQPGRQEFHTWTAALPAWLLLLAIAGAATAEDIELVGDYGDWQRLSIEGTTLFTADEIRQQLAANIDVRFAAHAQAPLAEYLRVLGETVEAGYLHSGCPNAKVEVERDVAAERIVVRCQEGPQYLMGEVRVQPADLPIAAALAASLLDRIPDQGTVPSGFQYVDGKLFTKWIDAFGRTTKPRKAAWRPEEPTEFDPRTKATLDQRVKNLCRDLGYYAAQCRVEIVPDLASGRADLIVEVTELGPAVVIGEIEITGNEHNSRDMILDFLDLRPDTPTNFAQRSRLAFDLWRSARFRALRVPTPGPPGPDGKVKLVVNLAEDADAPPLNEPFSREAQALLAARDWLADFDQQNHDVSVQLKFHGFRLESVFSPRHGLLLQLWLPGQAIFDQPPDYALVAADKICGLYSFRRRQKATISTGWVLLGTIKLVGDKFMFGGGVQVATHKSPAFHLDMDMPPNSGPRLLAKLRDKEGFTFSWNEDVLTMHSDTWHARIDAASGKILELTGASEEDRLAVRFEEDVYTRRLQELEQQTTGMTEQLDRRRAATSLASFLCGELDSLLREPFMEPCGKWFPIARKLTDHGLLRPIDQWLPTGLASANFEIPETKAGRTPPLAEDLVSMIKTYTWIANDHLFLRDSWCWALNNEWLLSSGKSDYLPSTLARLDAADNSGPICHLLLTLLAQQDATKFAEHGLERLSLDDFRNDYRPLLSRDAAFGQTICQVAEALRSLDPNEAALVSELFSNPVSFLITELHKRLHVEPDAPIETALAGALDGIWQNGFRGLAEAHLRQAAKKR